MTASRETAPPFRGPAPLTVRWTAVLAVGLGGLALAVAAGTFPLGGMARQLSASVDASLLVALVFAAVGLLVALRQPRNSMGWLLLAGAAAIALNFATSF
jgi:hypothetical protein